MAVSVPMPTAIRSPHHNNYVCTSKPKIPCNFSKRVALTPSRFPTRAAPAGHRKRSCRSASSEPITDSEAAVTWAAGPGGFSMSDAQLDSRGFALHRTAGSLDLDHLNALFAKVGFPRRQKEKLRLALRNTPSLLWVEHRKSGKVVAFARATGDEVFNAIIWDVVVDPSFQGCGLGKAVMERLMADLLAKGITNIALYAEPNVLGFYRPLGFTADPGGIKAMVYSNKPQRSR